MRDVRMLQAKTEVTRRPDPPFEVHEEDDCIHFLIPAPQGLMGQVSGILSAFMTFAGMFIASNAESRLDWIAFASALVVALTGILGAVAAYRRCKSIRIGANGLVVRTFAWRTMPLFDCRTYPLQDIKAIALDSDTRSESGRALTRDLLGKSSPTGDLVLVLVDGTKRALGLKMKKEALVALRDGIAHVAGLETSI